MDERKVLILGAGGMLGSAVFRALHGRPGHQVVATVRQPSALKHFSTEQQVDILPNVDVLDNDALIGILDRARPDVVINCVGVIKQLPTSKDPLVVLPLNTLLPHKLARLCSLSGARLVQISTDCVFTGATGGYTEDSQADAVDLYGISKHLGEVVDNSNAVTLRTSIIGRELSSTNSLVDWFLAQEGTVKGFVRAIFSGLPTCELARVIRDFVIPSQTLTGLYHVSSQPISKYDLLQLIAAEYGKEITIEPDDKLVIDRSLVSTRFSEATGYVAAAWPELIKRMHDEDMRAGIR